jgi:transcriptional regulator with XRE-family HTH domain
LLLYLLEQFSSKTDIELIQVHRVEKGKINPTLTTLIALAKGLGITLAELVGE